MTDKERKDTIMATLYELRLVIADDEKENFTKEEILQLLDKIAKSKDQEM